MSNPRNDKQKRQYTFGALTFSITGLGVFMGCPKLTAKISALSPEQAAEANREAWKQRRRLEAEQRRKNNVTTWGWDDARDAHCEVATVVCKETFKVMRSVA